MSETEAAKTPSKALKPEMLVGLSAVVIGVCALFVSLYETQLMREEQRASVLPILELSRSFYFEGDPDESIEWRLKFNAENVGIGPAKIMDFRVTVDGQPYTGWSSAIQAVLGEGLNLGYGQSTINGRTVPVERRITMFDLTQSEYAQAVARAMDEGRFNFEACYCSVFDECWVTSFQSDLGEGEPVAQCTRDENSFGE